MPGARPGAGAGHPGDRPRPPRRVPVRVRRRRRHGRADRDRGPPPRPDRGRARWRRPSEPSRRAPRPCPTSATRCSRSACAGSPGCSAATSCAGLEDVALWHERDISHSSVERIVLPDATALTLYLLRKADRPRLGPGRPRRPGARQPDRPARSASSSASRCCWPWWPAGLDPGRRLPDRPARRPRGRLGGAAGRFREVLAEPTPRSGSRPTDLDAAFDLSHLLRHADRVVAALDEHRHRGVSRPEPAAAPGKVRDLYEAGPGLLLMVASDRVSAYDVVFAEPIPDKGRVLTAMTAFWCEELADVVDHGAGHRRPGRDRRRGGRGRAARRRGRPGDPRPARPRCCRSSASSAATWPGRPYEEYAALGHRPRHGRCRPGCGWPTGCPSRCSPRRPSPRSGHDENIDFDRRPRRSSGPRRPPRWPRHLPRPLRAGRRPGGRGRADPGRHEVRARPHRRPPGALRRGGHPGLLAAVAGRPGGPGHAAARLRQAAACATGPPPSPGTAPRRAPAPRRGGRGHLGRYVAAYERVTGRSLADWYGPRVSAGPR